jgi:hypothetical protein
MPENGRYNLGLNFARVKQFVDQLREEPEVLANAGKNCTVLRKPQLGGCCAFAAVMLGKSTTYPQ